MYAAEKRVYRVPRSRVSSPFLTGDLGFLSRLPSPGSLSLAGFILSYASRLSRVLPLCGPPLTRKPGAPSLGFAVPLRDVSLPRPTPRAIPPARCLAALGVSHALDGFLRGWHCGSISPRCHVQGSLFRGLLLVRSRIAFRRPLPSRRCLGFADGQLPIRLHSTEPRPQGFAPRPNPESQSPGVSRCPGPNPLMSFSSSRFSHSRV